MRRTTIDCDSLAGEDVVVELLVIRAVVLLVVGGMVVLVVIAAVELVVMRAVVLLVFGGDVMPLPVADGTQHVDFLLPPPWLMRPPHCPLPW